jgi:hypothetical protein
MEPSPFRRGATVRVEPVAADAAYREAAAPSIEELVPALTDGQTALQLAPTSTYEIYIQLVEQGMTGGEATNLTAFALGIRPTSQSWTVEEINRLLFLREVDRRGGFPA